MGIGGGLCCVVRALLSGRDLPEIRLEISAKIGGSQPAFSMDFSRRLPKHPNWR
jgi:hypothetical protein